MKTVDKILVTISIVSICLFALTLFVPRTSDTNNEQTSVGRDTITIVKYDTVIRYVPQYVTKTVVDTLRVRDTVLLREQKRYFEDGVYEAFVSGYEPSLDSINVFQKTKEITVVEYRNVHVQDNMWHLYVGGGFNTNFRTITPQVVISAKSPQATILSANVGYNNGLFLGMTLQKEIKW